MNQSTQMDEARKAVKKQLLQTLMQQAVEDLTSESDDSIKDQIQSLSIDMDPLRRRIEQIAEDRVHKATRLDDAVLTNMVHRSIGNVDMDVYRNAINQTVGTLLQSRIDEIVTDVAEESAENMVMPSDLERQATGAIRNRLASAMAGLDIDVSTLIDSEATRRAEQVVKEQVERATRLDDDELSSMVSRFMGEVDLDDYDQVVSRTVESTLNERMEHILQQLSDKRAEQLVATSDLEAQATESLRTLLEAAIADLDIDVTPLIQAEAERRTDSSSPLVEQVSVQLRDALVKKAANVAVARLDDVDQVVREARELVAFDNDAIVAASTMLRSRILQDIARRTTKTFGDANGVADDAADWISADDPDVIAATEQVRAMALEFIRQNARDRIAQTDEMVDDAATVFGNDHELVRAASNATRDRIVQSVSRIVQERLVDTKQIALAAADSIPADSEAVQRIVKATLSLIVGEVIQNTQERLSQVEKLSSDARTRMPERVPEVESAASILENMLLQEVSEQASSHLHDIERTCNAAREKLTDESPIMVAAAALVEQLQQEVVQLAVKDLETTDTHAEAASSLVPADHPNMNAILREVQTRLVARVTESALDTIMEMDVQTWVRSDDERLESVRNVLRERIIGRILADTLGGLGQQASQSSDREEHALFQEAMQAVVKPTAASWKSLSDMPADEPEPEPEPEPAPTPVAEKSWEVSEIFARSGDGHDVVLDVPTFEDHIYVYGIVDVNELQDNDLAGMEGIETGSNVYLCSYGDLSAIVSSVPAAIYGERELERGMKDAAWVKEQVRRHAAVLSAIGSPRSIVPLKFGVVRASTEDVNRYLDSHREAFHETLGRLSNKQEFSVRIRVDMHRLGEHVVESDARIDASLNDMSSGVAGFIRDELKLRNQEPNEQEMATIIQNVVGQAHARLQNLSSESVFMNSPAPGATDVHRVVLNATYLVSTAHDAAFDAQVNEMANQFRHLGFEIQVSGPWAPYHFVHLNDESQEIPA